MGYGEWKRLDGDVDYRCFRCRSCITAVEQDPAEARLTTPAVCTSSYFLTVIHLSPSTTTMPTDTSTPRSDNFAAHDRHTESLVAFSDWTSPSSFFHSFPSIFFITSKADSQPPKCLLTTLLLRLRIASS